MKISIIVPCFNAERYIGETLRSIRDSCSSSSVELIVVDGMSTDATVAIAKKFDPDVLIVERDEGQSHAINKGIRVAHGEVVAWQNADDVYRNGAVGHALKVFANDPALDVLYGNYDIIDEAGVRRCGVSPPDWSLLRFRRGRFVPMQPTVFWRKRLHERFGLLDQSLRYCMDVDWFARLAAARCAFRRENQVLGAFRMHAGSLTAGRTARMTIAREHLLVLERAFHLGAHERAIFWYYVLRSSLVRRLRTGEW